MVQKTEESSLEPVYDAEVTYLPDHLGYKVRLGDKYYFVEKTQQQLNKKKEQ